MESETWTKALELHERIANTGRHGSWLPVQYQQDELHGVSSWQRAVLSRLLTLVSSSEDIRYLDYDFFKPEKTATLAAITADRLIWIVAKRDEDEISATARPLSDLKSVGVESVTAVSEDTDEFPTGLRLNLIFDDRSIPLPLSASPSEQVEGELRSVLPSLLQGL